LSSGNATLSSTNQPSLLVSVPVSSAQQQINHHQLQSLQHQGGQGLPVSVSNVLSTSQTVVLTNAQTYTTGGSMLSLPIGELELRLV
jgi:hypothetical protein